jgi:toxin CcdB
MQFGVYRNLDPTGKSRFPFLLDIQNDLHADLETRVVVPLVPAEATKGRLVRTLTPVFEIEGRQFVMRTPQLAGVAKKQLGTKVADLSAQRDEIVGALDLLIVGI